MMITDGIKPSGNSGKLRVCLIVMLAMSLHSPAAFSSNNATCLTLKAAARVEQESVRLSDIATLTGTSPNQLKTLGATIVASAPQPGQTRFVGIDYIRIRLKKAGVDTTSIVFNGHQDVRITRQAATLPTRRIQRAVEMAIRSRMPWKNEAVTISEIAISTAFS